MKPNFILNGQGHGSVANRLLACGFDTGVLRPFVGNDGKSYLTVTQNGKRVNVRSENTATLRKDEWIQLDREVLASAQQRLQVVADLRGRGLQLAIPNGLSKTILQTQKQSDIDGAEVSMDGLRRSTGDRPVYGIESLPLPIIHKDFGFSAREIAVSRNGSSPLDTTMAALAGRKVAEEAELMTLGLSTHDLLAYAGGTIYGLTDFTDRNTKSITDPTESGWAATTTVTEVLQMIQQAVDDRYYGPYMLYCGTSWGAYLDNDYSAVKGDLTLRERLKKIERIVDVKTLDYLTGYNLVLVQMTADVIRVVVGMEITTVQWESHGGMEQNFKVMAIMVPQIRADYSGRCGIVHGS